MSRNNLSTSLRLIIKPSKNLRRFVICLHVVSTIACIINGLAIGLKVLLCLIIVCHYVLYHKRAIKPYALEYTDSCWKLVENNEVIAIQILPSTVLSTFAIFLQINSEKYGNAARIICSDTLSANDYRALIAMLKITFTK